jgi:hypothetical protein
MRADQLRELFGLDPKEVCCALRVSQCRLHTRRAGAIAERSTTPTCGRPPPPPPTHTHTRALLQELFGCFLCAHTRPRWGAQFTQVR